MNANANEHYSQNLNRSSWSFDPNELLNTKVNTKKNRDIQILEAIYRVEDLGRVAGICMDRCVNDFSSNNLSVNEVSCLRTCKRQVSDFFFNLDHFDVPL